MVRKHPKVHAKLVEDKANGPAIISMLKNEIGGMIPVNPQGKNDDQVDAMSQALN